MEIEFMTMQIMINLSNALRSMRRTAHLRVLDLLLNLQRSDVAARWMTLSWTMKSPSLVIMEVRLKFRCKSLSFSGFDGLYSNSFPSSDDDEIR